MIILKLPSGSLAGVLENCGFITSTEPSRADRSPTPVIRKCKRFNTHTHIHYVNNELDNMCLRVLCIGVLREMCIRVQFSSLSK